MRSHRHRRSIPRRRLPAPAPAALALALVLGLALVAGPLSTRAAEPTAPGPTNATATPAAAAAAVDAAVGAVERLRPFAAARQGDASRPLAVADSVFARELLVTGPDGRLVVTLADGATLTLGARATLALDDLVIAPEETRGRLSLFGGPFLLAAGDRPHQDLSITTPVAVIGIRGTTVWGGWIDGQFEVMVVDGVVTVSNGAGRVVLDTPGQGTRVASATAAPTPPVSWPQAKRDLAYATVAFDD